MIDSAIIAVCAVALAVALVTAQAAWIKDAKRETNRALDVAEACADQWEQTIAVADQCLAVLDTVRAVDVACACWQVAP